MPSNKAKSAAKTLHATSFQFQRVFAGLHLGESLCAHVARQTPASIFMRQDTLSGACGLLCVGMALCALGVLKPSAFECSPRRKFGLASELWALLSDCYFCGIDVDDLHQRLAQLNVPVAFACKAKASKETDALAVSSLERGELTILAYENERTKYKHYVLGVGVAGLTVGRKSTVTSLLVLDPGGDDPVLNAYNGIMERAPQSAKEKHRTVSRWFYRSPNFGVERVFLIGAIRCRLQP